MRALLARFIVTFLAVFLVAYVVPRIFTLEPPINLGSSLESPNWAILLIFSAVLALVNTFIKPILKLLTLPITCLTAGLFAIVINLVMFFIAAWLTNLLEAQTGSRVDVGWLGALLGALAVALVGLVLDMFLPDKWES
jgi:putative membrane protein